ncbi:histone-lysine N-methyltransferase SETDB1-B-like [Acyrthosiphon pisum]|uniref:Histone-lysine N-methyltransferase n=1 Tax=Acyrthosiphon pisum TaxID=7029 RepID=A0A8R2H540_ACYPI|nr:histone-lysine N-methyltransferase SETDB1-B-like [Acyrthosiphon pisum]|eukprot:XP_001952511.2 PREDICTED: histone-lysine N-methyltransferase SETDB1-B-like [Acyrthosiphon pisum]
MKRKDTPIEDITQPIKVENIILQIDILQSSKTILSPKTYIIHKCNHSCVEWAEYDQNKTKKINMLAIPLHFGFNRHTTNGYGIKNSITYYETPCGISIKTMKNMMHYLTTTRSKMTIDQFDFNSCVNPLAQFNVSRPIKFLDDISEGLEFRPITCVNSINKELPQKIKYIVSRQAVTGVNINVESNFLCGCDCTDNCEDKSKCACWQSTINGQSNIPDLEKNPNAGYNYRRLYKNVPTGIYECNKTCKCHSSCLNRVVQQPMSHNLQLFKTEKKGWGVRCLNDIARGTFICCYIGDILTETNATEQGKKYGDEYLADLDFIEVVEKCKEDYEENAFLSQQIKKPRKISKKNMNLLNKLTTQKSSQGRIQTTCYDKNLALNNTFQFLESRNLKHKYLTFSKRYYEPQKSVRYYYGSGDGVYTINAKTSGNIGRYFNHSCTPNLFVQNVFVDTQDLRFPWVSFFSERYIPAGTELTWNYGYEVGSIPGKVMTCYCDSAKCKRRLL